MNHQRPHSKLHWIILSPIIWSFCGNALSPRPQGAALEALNLWKFQKAAIDTQRLSSKPSAAAETEATTIIPVRSFYQAFDAQVILPRIRRANSIDEFFNKEEICPCFPLTDLENDTSVRQRVVAQGGWCLLRLENNDHQQLVDSLWEHIDTILDFQSNTSNEQDPTKSNNNKNNNPYLRRQFLSSATSKDTGGSDYLEVSLANDSLERSFSRQDQREEIRDAFLLLGDIASRFTAAMAGGTTTDGNALASMNALLHSHNNGTSSHTATCQSQPQSFEGLFQGSSMRLSRYIHDTRTRENLRSHCDWTFCTVVPVSSQAGLEVFTGSQWIRPETFVLETNSDDRHHHSQYVVVLTGKWLELLGGGPSTVHRVMGAAGRPSAPFFLRPNLVFMDNVEQAVFLDYPKCVAPSALVLNQYMRGYRG